ncbi:TetR/AcrR family transcriptional regulator [Denitratisoma sp. DHT3]|uniref:TetR/AcrR family transcriptional regulator n=1 Tax=Denitratisoma sp. DHT3 TaxID=1981880 RepID=UPI001644BB60|nr:TetR/AcrR family transcriptional regulator [Denitratisoma sp. DHT3]
MPAEFPSRNPTEVRLLAVAREITSRVGYDGLTMKEVADRAAVARVTVYHYFGNKDRLLAEIAADLEAEVLGELERLRLRTRDPAARIARRLTVAMTYLLREPLLLNAVLTVAMGEQGHRVFLRQDDSSPVWHLLEAELRVWPKGQAQRLGRIFGHLLHSSLLSVSSGAMSVKQAEEDLKLAGRLLFEGMQAGLNKR